MCRLRRRRQPFSCALETVFLVLSLEMLVAAEGADPCQHLSRKSAVHPKGPDGSLGMFPEWVALGAEQEGFVRRAAAGGASISSGGAKFGERFGQGSFAGPIAINVDPNEMY